MDDVLFAKHNGYESIEAPRTIINYYNKEQMSGFESVGYFVYNNVRVYEAGKREETKQKEKAAGDLHKILFNLP